jgi:2-polyprenyl-3-methyl-5-hydroxy-6-metoxy-1,4-benzoquinol methylase
MSQTCPVCHSSRCATKKTVSKYTIWECRDCGLFWVPGVGEAELADFYSSAYFSGSQEFGYGDYLKTEKVQRLNAVNLLGTIANHSRANGGLAKSKLLDVGCAYGFLVDEACKAGAEAEGVDYSESASRYAQTVLGRKVTLGNLHAINFPAEHFDAVTSVGSIEHLNDPVAMVEEIARITKPGGLFVVTTLNTKSLIRIFRFKPPEHLYYFSHRSLALLLESKGFAVESVKAYLANHALGEAVGLLLKALFGPRINIKPLIKRMPWKQMNLPLPNNEMLMVARKR